VLSAGFLQNFASNSPSILLICMMGSGCLYLWVVLMFVWFCVCFVLVCVAMYAMIVQQIAINDDAINDAMQQCNDAIMQIQCNCSLVTMQ
jgi:uncharacterized membrane protein